VAFGERADAEAGVASAFDIDIPEVLEYDSFFFCEVLVGSMVNFEVFH
jgi:hypothetical protein